MSYSDLLRDPRWQKQRLEILERDDWACQICFDTVSTLNVHHRYYDAGRDPWDYPPSALVTLCESCHASESNDKQRAEREFIKAVRSAGVFNNDLDELSSMFEIVELDQHDWSVLIFYLELLLTDKFGQNREWMRLHDLAKAHWKKLAAQIEQQEKTIS